MPIIRDVSANFPAEYSCLKFETEVLLAKVRQIGRDPFDIKTMR